MGYGEVLWGFECCGVDSEGVEASADEPHRSRSRVAKAALVGANGVWMAGV